MLVTKGASQYGSVIVAHSDDSELFDQRLVYVPAADHKPGSLRPVYYDAASLGDMPEYHGYVLRRYVGVDRGPTYLNPDQPQSVPLNLGHMHDGRLFRGRYKSVLIDQDEYLLDVVRYILDTRRGVVNEPRNIAIFMAGRLRGDSLETIARAFNMNKSSSVSSVVNRTRKLLSSCGDMRSFYEQINRYLNSDKK